MRTGVPTERRASDRGLERLRRRRIACHFVRIHKSLKVSPAMAAGLTDKLWGWEDVIALIDAAQGASKKRGPYKKKAA